MSTQKELYQKYLDDLKELQSKCTHPESTWCIEQWAPAHGTGYDAKVCNTCGITIDRQLSGQPLSMK